MKITIIGAGIGGLTTAIALQQKGFEVELFEAAPEIREVGAGISLAFNAMQVYDRLGLAEQIVQAGHRVNQMTIADDKLRPISTIPLQAFRKKYGVDMVAIHRATLQNILADQVEDKNIHLGKRLQTIDQNGSEMRLHFEDGTAQDAELLIGADGIHSATRAYVTEKAVIRNANQPCWRGITDFELPKQYRHQLVEMWAKGKRFGFSHIADKKVYWYALVSKPHYRQNQPLAATFNDLAPLALQLIESTPTDQIIQADLIDLQPIETWHMDNICLIGDAAHATTPNMGQGACQAVEDAWALSHFLSKNESAGAFANFQAMRMPKAQKVVNLSWQIGKLAHMESRLMIWLRNTTMRAMPQFITTRQNEWLYNLGIN